MTTREPNESFQEVHEKALEAIVAGHYAQVLSEPATARTRAQTAYTIASATAAALVAAGVLADIGSYPAVVQVLGGLALGGWIVSAALFMHVSQQAKTTKAADTPAAEKLLSSREFVFKALARAKDIADAVDRRLNNAIRASWVALAITGFAFVSTLLWPAHLETAQANLILSPEGAKTVAPLCDTPRTMLEGELQVGSLSKDYAVIEIDPGGCRDRSVTLLVPPDQVQGAVSEEEDGGGFPWLGD
jgi:hypothetical protein